jgi:hypothetical protein
MRLELALVERQYRWVIYDDQTLQFIVYLDFCRCQSVLASGIDAAAAVGSVPAGKLNVLPVGGSGSVSAFLWARSAGPTPAVSAMSGWPDAILERHVPTGKYTVRPADIVAIEVINRLCKTHCFAAVIIVAQDIPVLFVASAIASSTSPCRAHSRRYPSGRGRSKRRR